MTKLCPKCNIEKDLNEFGNDKSQPTGKCCYCKKCRTDIFKEKFKTFTRKEKDILVLKKKNDRYKNPLNYKLMVKKSYCKRKGIPFNLTIEDIQIPEYCPILNIKLSSYGTRGDNAASIDRIDSKKGYIKGNVCIISGKANRLKQDATIEELEKIIAYMKKHSILTSSSVPV